MKKAAVIHDHCPVSGKCSLTAAIPVLSALGVQCCPVATAVLEPARPVIPVITVPI